VPAEDFGARTEEVGSAARLRVLRLLEARARPIRLAEAVEALGLHANTVRYHLERLRRAGRVERVSVRGAKGRPHYTWRVITAPAAESGPDAGYADVARWLARATAGLPAAPAQLRRTGRTVGRELAAGLGARDLGEALTEIQSRLGYRPRADPAQPGYVAYRLERCPYRDAVLENPAICTLHHGLMEGLAEALESAGEVTEFAPADPVRAGCRVAVRGSGDRF